MSRITKSVAATRKEDSEKKDNPNTTIIGKKEIKYEINSINNPEPKKEGGSIHKKKEGQNKQEKLTENSKVIPRNETHTTEEVNISIDIQMIIESQKLGKAKKEKVKKGVTKKKKKSSKGKRKENKANKANLTKENDKKKENFLGKKKKKSDTQSNIEDNEKIISSEEIKKANNPEGPIQNNNESFILPKILQNISSNVNNDSGVQKKNEEISKEKDPPESQINKMGELIEQQGFEKVIQTLIKPNLDEKNTVDSPHKGPMDSSSQEEFNSKVKFCILYFYSQIQEIKDRISKMSPSLSPKKNANSNKNESDKSLMMVDNNMILNENLFGTSLGEKNDKNTNEFQIKNNDEKNKGIKDKIGPYNNKNKNGEIYKYEAVKFQSHRNVIDFKCCDEKCKGKAINDLDQKEFVVSNFHGINNEEHNYIKIENSDDDGMKIMRDNIYTDLQIIKDNGEIKYKTK